MQCSRAVNLDLALLADLVLDEELGRVMATVAEQLDNLALVRLVDQDGAVGREQLRARKGKMQQGKGGKK